MRIIVGVVLGFFSGCLLSVMWTLLTTGIYFVWASGYLRLAGIGAKMRATHLQR